MSVKISHQIDPELAEKYDVTRRFVAYAAPRTERLVEGDRLAEPVRVNVKRLLMDWARHGLVFQNLGSGFDYERMKEETPELRMAAAAHSIDCLLPTVSSIYMRPHPETVQKWRLVKESLREQEGIAIPERHGLWLNAGLTNIHLLPVNGKEKGVEVALRPDFEKLGPKELEQEMLRFTDVLLPMIERKARSYGVTREATRDGEIAVNTIAAIRERQSQIAA